MIYKYVKKTLHLKKLWNIEMYFVIYNPNADNTYSNIWFP